MPLYLHENLIDDLVATPFTFLFDETTTSQVKKQYDTYVQYESRRYKRIVSQYAGSLFVGHCNADALKDHFFEFGRSSIFCTLEWTVRTLINYFIEN